VVKPPVKTRLQRLARLVDEADALAHRRGMAVHSMAWGAGYLLGPTDWSSSGSFAVIRWLPMPIAAWGALLAVLGLLMLWPRSRQQAHGGAAVFWFVWAVGLFLALPYGSAQAWGGWLHALVISYVHRCLSRPPRERASARP
jgi:hypothetical protein